MANITKYESKIIANIEAELREVCNNITEFPLSEIKMILCDTVDLLRDNKLE